MRPPEKVGPPGTTPRGTDTNTSGSQTTDRPQLTEDWRADVALLDAAGAPIPTVPTVIAGISDPFGALPFRCACGARWAGLKTCHCTACHCTFSTVTAFDRHRVGSHADSTRRCVHPARAGLVEAGRRYRCWAQARRGHGAQARRGDVDELRQKEAGGPGPAD
ncbi:FDXHR family putative zinc-binding protein [Mycobacterium sp.]|uniref:FDXHR family putative zinc-binding protein n=1 Tax=Mycobacterium sp. TaxID=1785 RepID=UPI003F9900C4